MVLIEIPFKKLLEIAILDCHFLFNKKIYKQVDGCAMGSPLGPILANIFMCNLEENFLNSCPASFKPLIYKRYVDDTFVTFKEKDHALDFLNFINTKHPNIKFTMEMEKDKKLPFLDIMVNRENRVTTSVYRKKFYTGLGASFYSFTPFKYKINSIKTLISRGYKLCSNWQSFNEEMEYLCNYFVSLWFP